MRNPGVWRATLTLLGALGMAAPALAADDSVATAVARHVDELPARFHVTEGLRSPFLDLLAWSVTFRKQCERIVDAEVRVVVELGAPWEFDHRVNALSTLVRDEAGRLRFVRVRLSREGRWSELLPHELEHVIEQIEGVNLMVAAAQRNGSAWRVGSAYETRRAHAMGHLVSREYRARAPVATVAAR